MDRGQDQQEGEPRRMPQRRAKQEARVRMAAYTGAARQQEEEEEILAEQNRGGRQQRVTRVAPAGVEIQAQQQALVAVRQQQQAPVQQQRIQQQDAVQINYGIIGGVVGGGQVAAVQPQAQQQAQAQVINVADGRPGVFQMPPDEDFQFDVPEMVKLQGSPQYQIVKRVGKGGFGQVFLAKRILKPNQPIRDIQDLNVAVKLEHKSSKGCAQGQPPQEWQIYQQIQQSGMSPAYGMPKLFYKGSFDEFYVMIMELLGPSLWDFWNENRCRLSQEFAACFAVEAVMILRDLHARGFIHGDVKPENFLLGPKGTVSERRLYLVDFGLSCRWKDARTTSHVKYNQKPDDFRGTVRYASIHAHLGRTASRRDDLESLAYTIIFMLKGRLPWQGYAGENKAFLVAKKKMQTCAESLCVDLKPAFKEFVDIIISLKFDEDPPYQQLASLFTDIIPSNINSQPLEVNHDVCVGMKRGRSEIEHPNIDMQARKKCRTGTGGFRQWITVYNKCKPMKQRYHFNVGPQRLEHHIQRGYDEGLRISAVASFADLWAVIMDAGSRYTKQTFTMQMGQFLPKDWIIDKWDQQYYITAVSGSDSGASLIVMSQGTYYQQQSYKVSDSFPYEWIKRKWKEGFFITSMATFQNKWCVVLSRTNEFVDQVIELDFQYPSEGIHRRWDAGYRITSCAATEDQAAFAMSTFKPVYRGVRQQLYDETQETLRTTQFPATHVKEKWEKDLYISGICFGRAVA